MDAKLTGTQALVLRLAIEGRSVFEGARGQAQHGGRATAIYSLIRRGLIDHKHCVTDAGKAVLAERAQGETP